MLRFAEAEQNYNPRLYFEYLQACRETRDFQRLAEAELSEGVKEVFSFIKELALAAKTKVRDMVRLFKDSDVFRFFAEFKFSFANLKKGFSLAYGYYRKIVNFLPDLATNLASLGITKAIDLEKREKIKAAMDRVNAWLKGHRAALAVSGVVFACLLCVIWLQMANTGDVDYDFEFRDLIFALTGKLTPIDFFMNKDGLKILILWAIGAAGFSVSYFKRSFDILELGVQGAITLVRFFAEKLKYRMEKGKDSERDLGQAEKDLRGMGRA
jgi:hypothetical protein